MNHSRSSGFRPRLIRDAALCGSLMMVLSACSGGGSGERLNPAPGEVPDVATEGRWSSVFDWPLIPIHVVLLPDGRVFSFGTDDGSPGGKAVPTGAFFYDIWTPSDGTGTSSHLRLPNATAVDTFCAAQLVLPQQDNPGVVVIGGDTFPRPNNPTPTDPTVPEPFDDGNEFSTVLDYTVEEPVMTQGNDMAAGRWYATATTLLDGRIYVQGGNSVTRDFSGELFPEVRDTDGVFHVLDIDTSSLRYYYPRAFVAPDGRLFGFDTTGKMYYVDVQAQTLTRVGDLPVANTGDDSTVAMFSPGRLLNFAGDSNGAIVIDIRDGSPQVTATSNLSSHRRLATATLLPNGHVLATGGSPVYNMLPGVAYSAEMWNPVTGKWTVGSEEEIPRLYHSTALLLPDATVLVAGGGAPGPGDLNNLNGEIYSPPYLFTSSGKLATRPVINSAPSTLAVARQFSLRYTDTSAHAARVVLVKTGATTHGLNMDQRFIELPFTAPGGSSSTATLDVRMPSNAAEVPPGYYLLFVLNANGVPSRARTIFINVADPADPAQDPTLTAVDDQTGTVGALESVPMAGSDPNAGTTLSYAAAGLPTGLSIDAGTGIISGLPTAAGEYNVVVSASDGTRTASTNFVWTIAAAAP